MPKLSRIQLLLAKTETTYGTSSSPAGADAVLVRNLDVKPLEAKMLERETVQPFYGSRPTLMADRQVVITFEIEVSGSGTAGTAPKHGPILRACGLAQSIVSSTSVTYSPVTTGQESVTISYHADGLRHIATGCRGTFELTGQSSDFFLFKVTLTGIYNGPTDTAVPSATYGAQAEPLPFGADHTTSVSVHGFSACLSKYSLDLGNKITFRALAGCSKEVIISDRKAAGSVTIEMPTLAAKDYFTAATDRTQASISFQHGATAGNIVTVTTAQAQLGAPAYADMDGVLMLQLPFMALPTAAGNNELAIVFT